MLIFSILLALFAFFLEEGILTPKAINTESGLSFSALGTLTNVSNRYFLLASRVMASLLFNCVLNSSSVSF